MPTKVLMPQLGESIAEGTIVRWNKEVGDVVDRDEPLFEISTDKVDAEIPSPAAGVVADIKVSEGETVPVDSVVAVIAHPGEEVSETSRPTTEEAPEASSSGTARPEASSLVGQPTGDQPRTRLSPAVRKIAREHNLDLSTIRGTGSDGRVTKADVLRQIESASTSVTRVEPMTVMRQRIAEHMVTSRRTSAHVHTVFEVDFGHVAQLRDSRKADYERAGAKLTYLAFIAKAVIDALSDVPVVNASLEGENIVYKRDVNLGIAVALDGGLIVPVIKRAQEANLLELGHTIGELADRARAKRLVPGDVEGGTFTVTNPGVFGSIVGMPIINQPQLAILCVGAVEKRPVVLDDSVVIRPRAYLTLGFDHRVIDGAVADQFMSIVKRRIEQFDISLL